MWGRLFSGSLCRRHGHGCHGESLVSGSEPGPGVTLDSDAAAGCGGGVGRGGGEVKGDEGEK